jgi:hypothetical protein
MRRSINIARQAGKPEGWLGRLIAFIMSFETSKVNKIALDLLEIQPNDKIFSVHTVYFWKDYRRSFSEISRVMKQGAKLVIGFRYDEKAKDDFPREVYTFLSKEELSDLLISEGFMIEHCKQDINRKQSFFWTVASKRLT